MKKYGNKGFPYAFSNLMRKERRDTSRLKMPSIQKDRRTLNVLKLTKMAAETNWGMLCPSNKLIEKSYLVDPKPYFERFLLINRFRSDLLSKLYV